MTNLGRLINSPGGCGEQNMIRFAPNVFVSLYLRQIMQLTPTTQKEVYEHIRQGYMHQLR